MVGVGYRSQVSVESYKSRLEGIDCLEFILDQYIDHPRRFEQLQKKLSPFKLLPHGVGLSIGSAQRPREDYLAGVKQICDIVDAEQYSEHLSFNVAPGFDLGHLAPVCMSAESIALIKRNVSIVQDTLKRELILENITETVQLTPGAAMAQAEVLNEIAQTTGCRILLDIENLRINSINHGFSWQDFLRRLPADSVEQFHLAGGTKGKAIEIDSHSASISEQTWQMYQCALGMFSPKYVIIERDDNLDSFESVFLEIQRAKALGLRLDAVSCS